MMNSQAVYLPLLISALAFLISFVCFFYFKSYLKRRTSQKQILAELQEEVNGILESINDTTDRNISLIEDSEKRLKGLLGEIEKRLRVYIREMERFGKSGTENRGNATDVAVSAAAVSAAAVSAAAVSAAAVSAAAVSGKPVTEKYRELGKNRYRLSKPDQGKAAQPAEAPEAPKAPEPAFPIPNFDIKADAAEKPPLAEQVRSLLRSGFSAPIVAGRLGVSIAEVELAAALLERRDAE